MAQKDKATLRAQAQQIRDETASNANTATRVGTMHEDQNDSAINAVETSKQTIAGDVEFSQNVLAAKLAANVAAQLNALDIGGGAAIGLTYAGISTAPLDGLLVEGDAGFGTNSPQGQADVNGKFYVFANDSANGIQLYLTPAGVALGQIYYSATQGCVIRAPNGGTQKVSIRLTDDDFEARSFDVLDSGGNILFHVGSTGNVGFATDTPKGLADINGKLYALANGSNNGIQFYLATLDDVGKIYYEPLKGLVIEAPAGGTEKVTLRLSDNNVEARSFDVLDSDGNILFHVGSTGRVGTGTDTPTAKSDINQDDAAGAIPVLKLTQADLSEEMIKLDATIAAGNPIEAKGSKTFTETHFIKINIEGVGVRYIPAGTIA